MAARPFVAGSSASISAYRKRMLLLRTLYNDDAPLAEGMTFDLILPRPPSTSSVDDARPLPSSLEKNDIKSCFSLTEPLQTGLGYNSQVWLAQSLSSTAGHLTAYEKLWQFQGSCIPYFYGVHHITMPWEEKAYLLVMEYITGPSLADLQTAIDSKADGSANKYRDYEAYRTLFHKALDTIRAAHSNGVYHIDITEHNILLDEENDRLVFINWQNVTIPWAIGPGAERNPYIVQECHDMKHLLLAFFGSKRHNRRLVKYIKDELPDIDEYLGSR
ncbi:hypothetical protein BD626DRAFT_627543 [Schizophyllum amplum]|uniref:Protein kinase domain-containing protein n=1 Tax=Schizophyllum amplum TaxID=97359 RepID=A0A550CQP9_9AGAR|nr:hypothetical protein BD626DRAFT_627543 [Auriculariopsis ampla]